MKLRRLHVYNSLKIRIRRSTCSATSLAMRLSARFIVNREVAMEDIPSARLGHVVSRRRWLILHSRMRLGLGCQCVAVRSYFVVVIRRFDTTSWRAPA
jgi:hypothetical protein